MWRQRLWEYYTNTREPKLPAGYGCMNPYAAPEALGFLQEFLHRFYDDTEPRTLFLGINPGRFGAGLTGISFTDPLRRSQVLGIAHAMPLRAELSSEFVYDVIAALGGPEAFFGRVFIGSVYPLALLKGTNNINYYELPKWKTSFWPQVEPPLTDLCFMPWATDRVVVIGRGANYEAFSRWNDRHERFAHIVPLPHPRWVMQYRRRHKAQYVEEWVRALG